MALIPKQEKTQRNHVQLRIGDDVLAELDRYCQFIESPRDYVVENILAFAFKKDRDFQEWLARSLTAPAETTSGRRRAANAPGTAGEAA